MGNQSSSRSTQQINNILDYINNARVDRFTELPHDVQRLITSRLTRWEDIQTLLKSYPDLSDIIFEGVEEIWVSQPSYEEVMERPRDIGAIGRLNPEEQSSPLYREQRSPLKSLITTNLLEPIWLKPLVPTPTPVPVLAPVPVPVPAPAPTPAFAITGPTGTLYNSNRSKFKREITMERIHRPLIWDVEELLPWRSLKRTNVWARIETMEQLYEFSKLPLQTIGIVLGGNLDYDVAGQFYGMSERGQPGIVETFGAKIIESLILEKARDPLYEEAIEIESGKFKDIVEDFISLRGPSLGLEVKPLTKKELDRLSNVYYYRYNLEDWDDTVTRLMIVPETILEDNDYNIYQCFTSNIGFYYDGLFGGRLRLNGSGVDSRLYSVLNNNLPVTTLSFYGSGFYNATILPLSQWVGNSYPSIKRIIVDENADFMVMGTAIGIMRNNSFVDELWSSSILSSEMGNIFRNVTWPLTMFRMLPVTQPVDLHVASFSLPGTIGAAMHVFPNIRSMDIFMVTIPEILTQVEDLLNFGTEVYVNLQRSAHSILTDIECKQSLEDLRYLQFRFDNLHLVPLLDPF